MILSSVSISLHANKSIIGKIDLIQKQSSVIENEIEKINKEISEIKTNVLKGNNYSEYHGSGLLNVGSFSGIWKFLEKIYQNWVDIFLNIKKSLEFMIQHKKTREVFYKSIQSIFYIVLYNCMIFGFLKTIVFFIKKRLDSAYLKSIVSIIPKVFLYLSLLFSIHIWCGNLPQETYWMSNLIKKIVFYLLVFDLFKFSFYDLNILNNYKICKKSLVVFSKNILSILLIYFIFGSLTEFIKIPLIQNKDFFEKDIIDNISFIFNIFFTIIMINFVLSFRTIISELILRLNKKNVIRQLTGPVALNLLILLIILFLWVEWHDTSNKLTRMIASFMIWPIIYFSSLYVRVSISKKIRSINYNQRKYIISFYFVFEKLTKFLFFPVSILATLKIWNIPFEGFLYRVINPNFLHLLYKMFLLWFFSYFLFKFSKYVLHYWIFHKSKKDDCKRLKVIFKITSSITSGVIWLGAFLFGLSLLGLEISPIIPALGFLTAGLTVSVSSIIKDFLNGILILLDNTITVGDIILINGSNAIIEDVHLRYMRARLDNGTLITIPFHKVEEVFNKSREFIGIVLNVAVTYETDIKEATAAIEEAFFRVRTSAEFEHKIILPIEKRGVSEVTGLYMTLMFKCKAKIGSQFKIHRAMNEMIKIVFDERGIKIPSYVSLDQISKAASTNTSPPALFH
ncbi:mechanosensitive ion channel family protein [Candidatus Nesciobacter abundans]|uniref:mechanosensitive ion channel family protein n=1 Tax=Candidatus Nesciobacter abundans TaxID=2601668 RepID=UPI001653967D|nr:mechanosensitive ion channel domain-containing protein [Candidatus Nesciobacter abundans]